MSLDVYLTISVDTGGSAPHVVELFDANITHNLGRMAIEAGLYGCLWRPVENGYTLAGQLVEPLEEGLKRLEADPAFFRAFDADNGWGTYDQFVPWIRDYLAACREHPLAKVTTAR